MWRLLKRNIRKLSFFAIPYFDRSEKSKRFLAGSLTIATRYAGPAQFNKLSINIKRVKIYL